MKPPTVHDMLLTKGKVQHLQLHVDSGEEAAAAEAAGILLVNCEDDATLDAVRAAAPTRFVSAGARHGKIATEDEAVRHGFALLARGADSIYSSGSPHIIEAMAREGIPVNCHIGLVPNWGTWTGFRAVGKTPDEAMRVYRRMKDFENAGAAFCEIEVVPVKLAAYLTSKTTMLTMGMGCGNACDTQYLFSSDVLGTHAGHYPRHSRKYADLLALLAQVQKVRIEAMEAFKADVQAGTFPQAQHQVDVDDAIFERFLDLAEKI